MSALQLYRGPQLQFLFRKRQGSPAAAVLMVDATMVMLANPSDFPALLAWLEKEAATLKAFMAEPEDPRVTDNMRGDIPE